MSFRFIDLFAGIGGFHQACVQNSGECVFASEFNEASKKTYEANFGVVPTGDITIPENKELIPGFDFLCAGFPCQPFSNAGLRKGFEETRGTLFFDVLEILKAHKPRFLLLENVQGIVSHDHGNTLRVIVQSLTDLGYHVYHKVLNSADYGLPQNRKRWYLAGFLDNVLFNFPEPTDSTKTLGDILDQEADDDASLKLRELELKQIDYHFAQHTSRVAQLTDHYKDGGRKKVWGVFSVLENNILRFHTGDPRKGGIQELYYCSEKTKSPTIIKAHIPKLWDHRRRLSVLECKRLQGFPDDFKFPVSDSVAYQQLGNSVSVPVISAIIKNMLAVCDL
jgi:DNA (cytosine-5)-methyltransferase 1